MTQSTLITIFAGIALLSVGCAKDPAPCFTVDKSKTPKVNEEVQFDASCSTNATSYDWDFGDGTQGSSITVKHKYTATATYNVTLKSNNASKNQSITQSVVIAP
jgi:PKD repeat protein